MTITSTDINSDRIIVSTDVNIDTITYSYGKLLDTTYTINGVADTTQTLTKETLGVPTLDNIYFKIEVIDLILEKDTVGLYTINLINETESKLYNANTLKQELDNLNYYDGIIESLTIKEDYFTANDMFNNFIDFLQNKLNGNNIFNSVSGQANSRSCN